MSRDDAPEYSHAKCCFFCLYCDHSDGNNIWCMRHDFDSSIFNHCGDYK